MAKRRNSQAHFAICIRTDDPDLLTPRMIYRVLPDASAERSRFLRVIDNEGEDYLYPADYDHLATNADPVELLDSDRAHLYQPLRFFLHVIVHPQQFDAKLSRCHGFGHMGFRFLTRNCEAVDSERELRIR